MAKKRKAKDPFDVSLDETTMQDLANWLSDELQGEEAARSTLISDGGDLDYFWTLYEQGSTRTGSDRPWSNAADLTSYLGTQYVDAFSSRVAKTIFVDPICTVEGFGTAASRAPIVEEFHQWMAGKERLKGWVCKALRPAFVEGTGVLEVAEKATSTIARRQRSTKALKVQTGPDQLPIIDGESGQPALATDASGEFQDAEPGTDVTAHVVVDEMPKVPGGPQYRVLSLKDFLILPGHARDRSEVWGWGKRFWRRTPELKERAKDGYYDAVAVEKLGTAPERDQRPSDLRAGQTIAPQKDDTVQKELWEVLFLKDFDGKGERWYVATVSVLHRVVLRIKFDELGDQRFVLFTPFPRSDSLYGYSFIGKILTLIEEHTALRNQITDRATLANSKPIMRLQGALWDPQEQPFGPGQVIDVRDLKELAEFQIADVPQSLIDRERAVLSAAERVSGMNDVALGTQPQEDRTLGEVNLVAQQSFIRIDEVTRNLQDGGIEELYEIRQQLYVRALRANAKGMPAPQSLMNTLKARGVQDFEGTFTVEMLEGNFQFKPRGSVETSDLVSMRGDFNGFLQLAEKVFPEIFQDPDAKKAALEQAMRVYRWEDRQVVTQAFQRVQEQALEKAKAALAQPPQRPGAPPVPPGGGVGGVPPHPMDQVMAALPHPPPMGMPPGGAPGQPQ